MKELLKALIKARDEFPAMVEDTKGQDGNRSYQYYTWDQIVEKIFPVLHKHDLILVHTLDTMAGSNGDTTHGMTASLRHVESDEALTAFEPFPSYSEYKIKEIGGLHTYFMRYTARVLLGLRVGEDDNDEIVDKRFNRGTRKTPAKKKNPAAVRGNAATKTMELGRREGGQMFVDFCNKIDDSTDWHSMNDIGDEIRAMDDRLDKDQIAALRLRFAKKQESLVEQDS